MTNISHKTESLPHLHFFSKRLFQLVTSMQFICMILVITLPGCRKDFQFDKVKNLSWNPDFALPLVDDSITLKTVLTQNDAKDHLYIDESGIISILYYYNNDAFRIWPNNLIKLSPVGFSFLHQIAQSEQNALIIGDLPIQPIPFPLNFTGNIQGMRVDSLYVKKGVIKVTTNHTFNNNGYMIIKIVEAKKNGLPFSFTIGPFVKGQAQTIVDISGVSLNLMASPNTLNATVEGLIKKSTSIVTGDEIQADFQVSIDTIGRFEGFLGQQTITQLTDTIKVNVFNNAFALGEVYFMDPQASITILNSIGIPTEITIEKLIALNNASGKTADIASKLGAGNLFSVPSPLITATVPATRTMLYTNSNTGNSMNDFFNVKPDKVIFQIKTVINPTGTPINFFSDTSSFYSDLRVKLPLWGHFDHLTFRDTFDLVIERPEELEHLEFRTKIRNGLPLTGLMQLYFTDDKYVVQDSLTGTDQLFIREAPVDPATYLPYPGMYGAKDTIFILDMQRMQKFKNVKKMLVKAVLHSSNEGHGNVKLMADQMIKLNFTAKAKLKKTIETGK